MTSRDPGPEDFEFKKNSSRKKSAPYMKRFPITSKPNEVEAPPSENSSSMKSPLLLVLSLAALSIATNAALLYVYIDARRDMATLQNENQRLKDKMRGLGRQPELQHQFPQSPMR
jgi:hypothetical protein